LRYAVCINPTQYVWFDGAHTSEREYSQLARLMWNVPPTNTGPYTMK